MHFSLLLLVVVMVDKGQSADCASASDNGNIRLVRYPGESTNEGDVQICAQQRYSLTKYNWYFVSSTNWTDAVANVACSQLGVAKTNATALKYVYQSHKWRYTGTVQCNSNVKRLQGCYTNTKFKWTDGVAGVRCNCINTEIRMVDGLTQREGRVEVCVDGRWGTVCNIEWGNNNARAVCEKLGFSSDGAEEDYFGEGVGPIYECSLQDNGNLNCEQVSTPSSCSHSNDAGVRCLPLNNMCHTTEGPRNNTSPEARVKTHGLGAVTGVLAAALLAVVVGWIGSCVYLLRRLKNSKSLTVTVDEDQQRHLDNPVYDGSTGPAHLQTNYSSVGPAYEPVNANQGTGYDVINRGGAPRPHPPVTPTGSHDLTSSQDYSQLNRADENNYHVLEPGNMAQEEYAISRNEGVSGQGGREQNQEETPTGYDPLDYEIPIPTVPEKSLAEYSTLRH